MGLTVNFRETVTLFGSEIDSRWAKVAKMGKMGKMRESWADTLDFGCFA